MGILIFDIQQIMMSNLAMMLSGKMQADIAEKTKNGLAVSEDLLRHMILNSIRSNRNKFPQYKETVIATDGFSWRRENFKEYKASRKTTRDASSIDWKEIFTSFAKIREELKTYFPYRVIFNDRAEADDIIAQIVYREAPTNDIMIISGDKDFRQLQTYEKVKQYDPTRKKFIVEKSPMVYLTDHILLGDSDDGIPNILSDNDAFVNENKRQKSMTQKILSKLRQDIAVGMLDKELENNYNRNKTLIDLRCCPKDLCDNIMKEYDEQKGKTRSRIFTYMTQNRLSKLMESISDF